MSADHHGGDSWPLRVLLVERLGGASTAGARAVPSLPAWNPATHQVRKVLGLTSGLEALATRRHDVVLADALLGDGEGAALAEASRNQGLTQPVLLLAAELDEELVRSALAAGVSEVVSRTGLSAALLEHQLRTALARAALIEAQHRSQAGFRSIVEALPLGVAVLQEGRISWVNPSLASLLRLDADPVGRAADDLGAAVIHPEDRHAAHADAERVALQGVRTSGRERRYQLRDGSTVQVTVELLPTAFEGRPAVLELHQDVTEFRRGVARERRADELATVGALAQAFAHDISNPLSWVLANLGFVSDQLVALQTLLPPGEGDGGVPARLAETREAIDEIRSGADRVRRTVADLRLLTRSDLRDRRPVDLHRLIDGALPVVDKELRLAARLVREDGPVPEVLASEARLEQMLVNLLRNAAQSIAPGKAAANEVRITTRTDEEGRAVIEVRDTGSGIPLENLPRIFDPFFTTRSVGMGTGLGLTLCRGVVDELRGEIAVESVMGEGTLFRVTLPQVVPVQASTGSTGRHAIITAPGPEGSTGRRAGGERPSVLAIDDEPMILKVLRRALGKRYQVTTCATAREGIVRIFGGERFDVILCDVMMPETTGPDFYEELRRYSPEQAARVVFITGGAFTAGARAFLARVSNPRLEKPIDLDALEALLDELIGRAPG